MTHYTPQHVSTLEEGDTLTELYLPVDEHGLPPPGRLCGEPLADCQKQCDQLNSTRKRIMPRDG